MDSLTAQILKNLMEHPYSFNELVNACPNTSRNTVRKKLYTMKRQGLIKDKRPKKHSGKKEQISITAKGRGVYIAQLTHNLPQQLKSLCEEIKLIKSEIRKPEYQTNYKQNLDAAEKQIETKRAELEKACEEKGLTLEQGLTNLINDARTNFKTSEEITAFFEKLTGTNLVKDLKQPLHDATKELFELYLYFNKQVSWPEGVTDHHWVVFKPGMELFYAVHTREPVAFEIMLMKMRAEEKANIEYVNKTCKKPIRYWQDYDKEVKEYLTQHQEEIEKYLREMPWRKQTK